VGLITIPDPVSIYESAKNAGLERQTANALVSSAFSAQITFLWKSGSSKWAAWMGEGDAMKAAATAMYLTLSNLETKNFLTLTVPTEMLSADNLSKFQSEWRTK
jgi:hypothetical protein